MKLQAWALSLVVVTVAGCRQHPEPRVRRVETRLAVVTIPTVIAMLQQGNSSDFVALKVREAVVTPPSEQWTADDIVALKKAGATDALIAEMQQASHRPPIQVTEYPY